MPWVERESFLVRPERALERLQLNRFVRSGVWFGNTDSGALSGRRVLSRSIPRASAWRLQPWAVLCRLVGPKPCVPEPGTEERRANGSPLSELTQTRN